ncbi:hypothetical protein H634G_06375 [Metarhizium anisopliae BRIP 53293]|uniref:Uncharacterized protein n=1 Tax=Metarhizium anisopliae BRIP 53293 TaxID=1291518 RepID=A0A0D9NVY8_METAN|nr:hypothetical protein H634G_06375 [Metarhizium anisopliae BRIP 53293]KJK86642.1 hypothetical protein H633G_09511 [Metarhizium anisopliae BRIP 53284]
MPSTPVHHILDSDKLCHMYEQAQAYEAFVKKLWNHRYNKTFILHDPQVWSYSTEQYPYNDIARNEKLMIDGVLEKYVAQNRTEFAVSVTENKKDGQTAGSLEAQAMKYARVLVEDNELQLPGIYVHTNIGRTFRLWYYRKGSRELDPLFGGASSDRKEYVDIASDAASRHWKAYVDLILGIEPRWEAPTLTSSVQTSAYDFNSGESSSSAASAYNQLPPQNIPMATLETSGICEVTNVHFGGNGRHLRCTFKDENGVTQDLATYSNNWEYDAGLGAYVFSSNHHGKTFGYYAQR